MRGLLEGPTPDAPEGAARHWTLRLPFTAPLSLNDRLNRHARARLVRVWRDTGTVLARKARIPRLEAATAVLHYYPRTTRSRDTDNLAAYSLKALVDGLRDAGVLDDDDATRYTLSEPVIHRATGEPGRLFLVVVDLEHRRELPR